MTIFLPQVIQNCTSNWEAGPHVTVDEQLIPFRGRCIFRTYIANKPAKYGIKIFMVNDSDTAYCINAIPYLGADSRQSSPEEMQGKSAGEYFTMKLIEPIVDTPGRTICLDNWFTSLDLAKTLLS